MRNYRRSTKPTARAFKWAQNLSYSDRLAVRELLFKLYSVSEDWYIERKIDRKRKDDD